MAHPVDSQLAHRLAVVDGGLGNELAIGISQLSGQPTNQVAPLEHRDKLSSQPNWWAPQFASFGVKQLAA